MRTYMVTAYINNKSDRGYLENIEGSLFCSTHEARRRISDEYPGMEFTIDEISEFTTRFNNQEISEAAFWIAWIGIK